jgi:ATP-dependent Clp protease protease subunit
MRRREERDTLKFWNWIDNKGERTLYLDGAIAEESWFGDEITPKLFKDELLNGTGDITVWLNSPGGDVFAASQIYNMLMDYKGKVTVKIDGIAASAASVIAMAGSEVLMSPVSMMMIHNPMTIAFGDSTEMGRAITMLDEVKESIINAYELKTGLARSELAKLMNEESWFNAKKAIELGFADAIMFTSEKADFPKTEGLLFSKMVAVNSFLGKLPREEKPGGVHVSILDKRLDLLKHQGGM